MGMSSKQKQIPAVRFNGFTEAWEQRKVRELFTVTRGQVLAATRTKEKETNNFIYPVYSSQTKNNGLMGFYDQYLFEDAITWTTDGANAGTVNFRKGKFYSTNVNGVLLSDEGFANNAVAEIINKIAWKHVSKVGNPKLMNNVMAEITVAVPSIEEQNKLSSLFRQLDDTIALHQRQLDNCKQLKNSMMQKIFNQELRFKDENGKDYPEWQKYDLSEIVDRVTRKNTGLISELPLTISAQYGLVDQLTFFNKTIAGVNLEAYYLLKNGEFAYNKSYSSGYPLGAIKRLDKYDAGLLSTLYICFSPRNNVDSDFLTQYFESTKWHKQIVNISGEGARNHGLLNIAVGDFFNTEHILPCKEEQQQIATLLYSLDNMIDLSTRKVDSLNEQKKELMKRMFV